MPVRWIAVVTCVLVTTAAYGQVAGVHLDTTVPSEAGTRQVRVTPLTIVPLHAHLRFSTLIVLPATERILEAHCGDKAYWQISVSAVEHIASIKPSKVGTATNINLFTASGNVYSFFIRDVSATSTPADLKVFVEPDESMLAAVQTPPKYVPYSEVAIYQERAETALADAQTRVDRALIEYPESLSFSYVFERQRDPFYLDQIWHDHHRTYVRMRARELPALYEVKDGEPSLLQFTVQGQHLYVIPKILDAGYFTIGRQRAAFRRER